MKSSHYLIRWIGKVPINFLIHYLIGIIDVLIHCDIHCYSLLHTITLKTSN